MATPVKNKPRAHAPVQVPAQASASNTIDHKIDGFKIQEDGRLKIHVVRTVFEYDLIFNCCFCCFTKLRVSWQVDGTGSRWTDVVSYGNSGISADPDHRSTQDVLNYKLALFATAQRVTALIADL